MENNNEEKMTFWEHVEVFRKVMEQGENFEENNE